MSKWLPTFILVGLATVLLTISFAVPHLLNDDNALLKDLVGSNLLAILGFIVAVTAASSATVHFELNRLERESGKPFTNARRSLRLSLVSLIIAFGVAIVLVTVKPLLPTPPYNAAVANAFAILILYFNLSVLLDITRTILKIPATVPK